MTVELTAQVPADDTHVRLGQVSVGGEVWTVEAHIDADRFTRHTRKVAGTPELDRDRMVITYPVPDRESASAHLLSHAPHALAWHLPRHTGPVAWQPRTLANGHLVHEALVANIEGPDGSTPVIARHDTEWVAISAGLEGGLVAQIGEGATRRVVVGVPSMDATRGDAFRILTELGSFHPPTRS
ncbi:hypothetical protein DFP74_5764 [Nocardiopsis sp. Huas11]|uniref:hypothetical protein n=1 Tax=Nocardiopsis sp. Huas11 TaxID=2183912 RepID=UPI000EACF449|nr:hypothetical protein [Nocardiopsis sp. Huas11]RKS10018.1 hypothetical protein DFP74_5764 [Nocardiopsis sp. Huas11]